MYGKFASGVHGRILQFVTFALNCAPNVTGVVEEFSPLGAALFGETTVNILSLHIFCSPNNICDWFNGPFCGRILYGILNLSLC